MCARVTAVNEPFLENRLINGPKTTPYFGSLRSTNGLLRSTRGPGPAPPLNNKLLAVARDRLVCAPPCVCTALCVDRKTTLYFGPLRSTRGPAPAPPLNNKIPAVAIGRLVCAPPCVWTAKPPITSARFAQNVELGGGGRQGGPMD